MKLLLTLPVLLISCIGFSQNYARKQRQVSPVPTNQSLYKVQFELKDYVFADGDSTLLDSIIFELLPLSRQQSVDVEVYSSEIEQTIILYSQDKVEAKSMEKLEQD